MKLFEYLNDEICKETNGTYIIIIIKMLGHERHCTVLPTFRANQIYAFIPKQNRLF